MDFNNSFSSRRFYGAEAANNSTLNSSARGFHRTFNETNDSYRTGGGESQFNYNPEESVRNSLGIQRSNTITGFDSSFSTRRRIMLQSTPITNRRMGDRVPPIPNIDVSTITTANENEDNKRRATEDRSCVPHFFGVAGLEKPQRDEIYMNKLADNDINPALNLRTLFAPSCSRSNTFANRREIGGRDGRFSPYPKAEKETRKAGPPLRSLNDSKPMIRRKVDELSLPPKPTQSPDERDFWVTVFGFNQKDGNESIIELFSRHGQVVNTAYPNGEGNWIHLRYATKIHAEQALQRNGERVDNYYIGCLHDSNVQYGSDSGDWKIVAPSTRNIVADKSANNVSLSSPQPSSNRFITGMRSLAAPSPTAPTPPSKGSSLISFLFKGKNAD
jgi:hypothetical protein|uniref:Nucleoporin NUP35 n=1 Tax=Panagrolaimus sp. PS1159 TaxID=55785 RepID=A0AC35F6Q8_9BILA